MPAHRLGIHIAANGFVLMTSENATDTHVFGSKSALLDRLAAILPDPANDADPAQSPAFREGMAAGRLGLTAADNPYPKPGIGYGDWETGRASAAPDPSAGTAQTGPTATDNPYPIGTAAAMDREEDRTAVEAALAH